MLMFNIIYSTNKLELPISPEITIMELKMNIMGILDLDMNDFLMLLENVGNIDMEEMLELPLVCLDLSNKYF